MSEFIGGTIALECWVNGKGLVSTKVEFWSDEKGIKLQAVSGKNLAEFPPMFSARISAEEFEDRPRDIYDDTVVAIWALAKVGLVPAVLDEADEDEFH
ncbi:hypothetical protein KYK30_31465 [Shinella yambaruensis]|uniref:Phage protein n=1 Tax=Shinella yambaruensis TaxID=415996 RepID=A0ABQ5ZX18_9HYPH|nr:hypothetical protein [Shinella yambaruensis]MCJ8029959.1 hypothetical protein [Shinella yambaruensis]MCU7984243.1 hypothetical protein [Shinella yambaruensis]GLR55209.1 hypothetical protein GCM10007923_64310 [Shinella yambaruensis]